MNSAHPLTALALPLLLTACVVAPNNRNYPTNGTPNWRYAQSRCEQAAYDLYPPRLEHRGYSDGGTVTTERRCVTRRRGRDEIRECQNVPVRHPDPARYDSYDTNQAPRQAYINRCLRSGTTAPRYYDYDRY